MKQIKKTSLIFVLLFAMVGLSGCGGSKIANEYYEFNDWLNENIEFKDAGQAGSKYLYTMTNKTEYNLKRLNIALVPEAKADIKKLVKETKEFKDEPEIIRALGIQGAASIIGLDINAKTTLNLYSEKKIDVENCKIIFNDALGSIEDGEIKKDGALKDGTKFKETLKDSHFNTKPSNKGGEITVTNDGASEYVLDDSKVVYQYSITNDGEGDADVTSFMIVSKKTGDALKDLYPLQEGLISPTNGVTVGAGKTVQQGCEENITDPIYLSKEIYYY